MGDTLKRIAHSLGLTRKTESLSSGTIDEVAVVEAIPDPVTIFYPPFPYGYSRSEGISFVKYVYYPIIFRGSRVFEFNNEHLHRTLKVGDTVNLSYVDMYQVVSDYVGENFSKRSEIERTLEDTLLISADKI